MPIVTLPEIQRTSLVSAVLYLKSLEVGVVEHLQRWVLLSHMRTSHPEPQTPSPARKKIFNTFIPSPSPPPFLQLENPNVLTLYFLDAPPGVPPPYPPPAPSPTA